MSKQITPEELAEIVNKLLLTPGEAGELDSSEKYGAFVTDIAKVICDHCGGFVSSKADDWVEEGKFFVGINDDGSLPEGGGIWAGYDSDGDIEMKTQDSRFVLEPLRIAGHLDSDKKHLNGVEVEIVRVILEAEPGYDDEVLPMLIVKRVDTGERLTLFPEELNKPLVTPKGYIRPRDRA